MTAAVDERACHFTPTLPNSLFLLPIKAKRPAQRTRSEARDANMSLPLVLVLRGFPADVHILYAWTNLCRGVGLVRGLANWLGTFAASHTMGANLLIFNLSVHFASRFVAECLLSARVSFVVSSTPLTTHHVRSSRWLCPSFPATRSRYSVFSRLEPKTSNRNPVGLERCLVRDSVGNGG